MVKEKLAENKQYQDKFRGCMIGGAAGDALGTSVEFWSEQEIFGKYKDGIQSYEMDFYSGLAEISDDTQMTMFTANGILFGETRNRIRSICEKAENYIYEAYLKDMLAIMDKAVELSKNEKTDVENIHELGEGWVAEEAFAIALYCSLRYQNDFSKAIIAAVNHKGDSDSTGAIAGNIAGAFTGYEQMEDKWKQNLELKKVILELADDLCDDCQMNKGNGYTDEVWLAKYGYMVEGMTNA